GGRSLTSASPAGRNASPHGTVRCPASTCTRGGPGAGAGLPVPVAAAPEPVGPAVADPVGAVTGPALSHPDSAARAVSRTSTGAVRRTVASHGGGGGVRRRLDPDHPVVRRERGACA